MSDKCFHGRNSHSCELCQQPKPETDNDTQFELAAWELLKEARQELADYKAHAEKVREAISKALEMVGAQRDEARELARELRDALVSVRRQCDWDGQKVVDGLITKAKEVLP